jgi:hypothetical protein
MSRRDRIPQRNRDDEPEPYGPDFKQVVVWSLSEWQRSDAPKQPQTKLGVKRGAA